MTDQLYIDQDGSIGSQPLTWDGQPLYSRSSVQEGLFEADAFSQFKGQQALETYEREWLEASSHPSYWRQP